jgi:hypothetical protein
MDSLVNELGSLNQQSTFFKRKLFASCGYVDEKINCCMDQDLFIRFLLKGNKIGVINKPLANFRIYANTKTSTLEKNFLQDKIAANKKYHGKKFNKYLLRAYMRLYVILPLKRLIGRSNNKD